MFLRKELLKRKELELLDTVEATNIGIMSISMHIPVIFDESNQTWLPESWTNLKLKKHMMSSINI